MPLDFTILDVPHMHAYRRFAENLPDFPSDVIENIWHGPPTYSPNNRSPVWGSRKIRTHFPACATSSHEECLRPNTSGFTAAPPGPFTPTDITALPLPPREDGSRRSFARGGYAKLKAAQAYLDHVRALLPDAEETRRRLRAGQDLVRSLTVAEWLARWLAGKRTRDRRDAALTPGHRPRPRRHIEATRSALL